MKQAKTVSEIKSINDVLCKDLCKGGKQWKHLSLSWKMFQVKNKEN
jgi:hypothetical protein